MPDPTLGQFGDSAETQLERALFRTAREAAAQMYSHEITFTRAVDLLTEIKAICDEPLDERAGHGPTRLQQFARIDKLVADLPGAMARGGFDWGEVYERGEEWVSIRSRADLEAVKRAETQRAASACSESRPTVGADPDRTGSEA